MKKQINYFVFILLSFILFSSCELKSSSFHFLLQTLLHGDVKKIEVSEIKNPEKYIFIDARTPEEFNISHVQNAIRGGFDDFDTEKIKNISHLQNIIVYCSIGYRSEKITRKLNELGYVNAVNLYGGIFEWSNQGKPLYDNFNKPTYKVHPYNKIWSIWLNSPQKNK